MLALSVVNLHPGEGDTVGAPGCHPRRISSAPGPKSAARRLACHRPRRRDSRFSPLPRRRSMRMAPLAAALLALSLLPPLPALACSKGSLWAPLDDGFVYFTGTATADTLLAG